MVVTQISFGGDASIQTVCLIAWTGGEIQRVDRLRGEAIAKCQSPQAFNFKRTMILPAQLPDETPADKIVCIDAAIAEIAYQ